MASTEIPADPDQFLDYPTPGAQEWWYFDAISDDGRDVLVLVWYAALPFDPAYGMATLRHLKRPDRHPAPVSRDHCAFGVSWYRDGMTMAYALNGYRSADFRQRDEPFSVGVERNVVSRDSRGYDLHVETPTVDGAGRIDSKLRFEPSASTASIGRNLGSNEAPHLWILAAADCRVSGRVSVSGRSPISVEFRGRGYHDHNAGAEEISLAQSRWTWGRVHIGARTHIYYRSESRIAGRQSLRIDCEDGRPEIIHDGATSEEIGSAGNVFGIRHGKSIRVLSGSSELRDARSRCVDDGPFYRRWIGTFTHTPRGDAAVEGQGISEILDTRNLNRPLFNWMIPYRLKKPRRR